jgi:hypothetical protein
MGKLTAVAVKAALANPGTYQDGDGLFLKVDKRGGAYWNLRVQQDGKRRDIGIGSAKLLTLADARHKAAELRRAIKVDQRDVLAEKKDDAAAKVTFRAAALQYHSENVRDSGVVGCPPEDWDLDAWMARSFGIWQEADHDIVFRILPHATERARAWRFHPKQQIEEDGEELVVRFSSGGLVELANHLFGWAGDLIIEQPEALKDVMCERLATAQTMVRPDLS